jgi:hypothetical protein
MRCKRALGARCALCAILSCLGALGQERSDPANPKAPASVPESASAEATHASTARALAARPNDVPTGAVKLAPAAGAVKLPSRARDPLRIPLRMQAPDGGSEPASATDVFGIASGAGRIDATHPDSPLLEVPPRSVTIVTSQAGKANVEQEELSSERKTALPWLVVERKAMQASATPPAEAGLRTSRPFLTLARAISWDAASSRHVAEFLFGLDLERGEPGTLEQPIDVRFSVSCDDVSPASARLASIGPSGYESVKVSCSRAVKNDSERQWLELFAGQGSLRYAFRIPHRTGALELVPSSERVLGFGFGRVVLTVRQLEEDGSPYREPAPHSIQLIAQHGEIDVPALTIPEGASEAQVELHPRGIAALELVASSEMARSAPVQVELDWPFLPIAAMLSGGALGGLVSTFGRGSQRRPLRRSLQGAAMGLLVTLTVLVVPGIASLVEAALASELACFVVAALAGFAGRPLIDRAARMVFPSLAEPPATGTGKS